MFTQISWGSYITIIVVLLIAYYFFVGFRYYRTDLLQLLSGRKTKNTEKAVAPLSNYKQSSKDDLKEESDYQLTESLSDDIRAFINASVENKSNNGEVINGLKRILGKYPSLKDSSFREFIQNIIISESEANLSLHFSPEEAAALWI